MLLCLNCAVFQGLVGFALAQAELQYAISLAIICFDVGNRK
jgi:hypothetical protein